MTDAFTNAADLKPFTTLPNQIPLTYGLAVTSPNASAAARPNVMAAVPSVPQAAKSIAAQWQVWSSHQNFGGPQSH